MNKSLVLLHSVRLSPLFWTGRPSISGASEARIVAFSPDIGCQMSQTADWGTVCGVATILASDTLELGGNHDRATYDQG